MPWTNYPQAASDNAKKALDLKEGEGTDCGTVVGWNTARILANKEVVSVERLPRIYSFLSRAKVYDTGSFKDEDGNQVCGSIMYAAWGGDEMLEWAEETLNGEEMKRHIKEIVETDDEIIISFGKGKLPEEVETSAVERAEPNELKAGDFVRWNTSGGNAYGLIIQVESNGELEADSGFKITGTPEDPAALIRIYRYSSDDEAYVERKPALNVVHSFSTLEKYDAEVRGHQAVVEKREFRMEDITHEGKTVRGYAAVYNSDSEWMGGFYEQIAVGAFDEVLDNDVRAYFNHDENLLLGRVSSGTLRIGVDARGLWYEVDMPNTSYANDLVELMKRGDVNQSSFAFLIGQDRWEERNGKTYRIIEKVSRLLDVSPVAQPAYPDATSELVQRNNTPESSEGAEVEAKAATEEISDIEIFEYKLKILKLD